MFLVLFLGKFCVGEVGGKVGGVVFVYSGEEV